MDLTLRAVERQIAAMCVDSFEVGVFTVFANDDDHMALRTWDRDQIRKSLGWLKQRNIKGAHIFIRPLGSTGLIFIDDLTLNAWQRLENDGIKPACVIESSPDNYQAWVRVSNTSMSEELATATGKALARRYDGDPNSVDWRHFGRLAGFTNRKPEYVREDGAYPFVLIRESTQKAGEYVETPIIETILADAHDILEMETAEEHRRLESLREARSLLAPNPDLKEPGTFYRTELHGLMSRYGKHLDLSKADWVIGRRMAELGYTPEQVMIAYLEASPSLQSRKSGHIEDYVTRTANKIFGLTQ